jgi:3-phytase
VVASNRTDDSIVVAVLDPSSRRLDIRWVIPTDLEEIYGICAALTPAEDGQDLHIIANDKSGRVQHRVWRRAGGVSSIVLAREFHVGSQPEGMVADETHGWLYVGEENAGVWRYPLDPGAAPERTLVDAVRPVGDHLTADVEGLTLVRHGDGSGYLVVSSQGSDRFVAYDRETGAHAFTFRVIGESGIDGVTETDGIDATARPLGPDFPRGLLVVQDDENPGAHQNFKYVSWADVLEAAGHVGRGAHEN